MKMPNAALAISDRRKIVEYLLDSAHPDNGGKALFFHMMGFDSAHWSVLADVLRDLSLNTSVADVVQSVHGSKYVTDGALFTPCGKRLRVRTLWSIDRKESRPRLVTAYPKPLRATP